MHNFKKSQIILVSYSGFIAIAAALVIGNMLLSPSESGSVLVLGLSTPRLVMVIGLLFAFILFGLLTVKSYKGPIWVESFLDEWFSGGIVSQRLLWLSGISFTLSWIVCFLPVYRVVTLANYWMHVQPIISFILLVSLATIFVFLWVRIQAWSFAALKLGLPLFLINLIVLIFILYRGSGWSLQERIFGTVQVFRFWQVNSL